MHVGLEKRRGLTPGVAGGGAMVVRAGIVVERVVGPCIDVEPERLVQVLQTVVMSM
jgi:hypothetical protein